MTPEQGDLLARARESLEAARELHDSGHFGYAASRAYYTMFYVAQALLLGKGLAFSKHAAVHAAFGKHFAKARLVPPDVHQHLIHAMGVRHAGDYGPSGSVGREDSQEQIARAQRFLDVGESLMSSPPEQANTQA
jgi:uncharacterized protein (UPF0332 family)